MTYVPALNYFGSDGFFYLASDSHGGYVFGVNHVTVQSVNDAPFANAGPDKTSSEASSVAFSGALSSDVDDALLIGGFTTFDSSLTSLYAIRSEWTSSRSYATRIANLRGPGTLPRNNGSVFLTSATVLNDTSIDKLYGEAGLDWFWGKLGQDLFQDRSSSESQN